MSRTRRPLRAEPLEDRLTPAAVTLDPSFGTGGTVVLNNSFAAVDTAVDSLGRVVVVGDPDAGGGVPHIAVLRLNPDGTPDPTFGTNGRVTLDLGGQETPSGVAVDALNNVLVVGTENSTAVGNEGIVFVRLTAASGALDPNFGQAGSGSILVRQPNGFTSLQSDRLVFDVNGRPIAGATVTSATGESDLAAVRLTVDGSMIDPTFNGGAVAVLAQPGVSVRGGAVAADADGRITVAGTAAPSGGPIEAAVARLSPDGTPDQFFNGRPVLVSNVFGGSASTVAAVATMGDTIYLTGSQTGLAGGLPVVRLTNGGIPDQTFGTNGVALLGVVLVGQSGSGTGIKIDPTGRIVVAGTTVSPSLSGPTNFMAARLLPNGTLDPAFNPAGSPQGVVVVDLGGNDQANAMALTPDGKGVVVAGGAGVSTTEVVRLTGGTGLIDRPRDLSVGGSAGATAGVFTPDAGNRYVTPPARTTPSGLFPGFGGEVRPATGDFNGDGVEDTVLVTGPGTKTLMAVVSGKDNSVLLQPTDPFGDASFTFGGFVTAGDIDHDGRWEWVVTPELRGGPRVIIFGLNPDGSLKTEANFFGIGDPAFRDGDRAALGDMNGDGVLDVFSIAAFNGGPRTALYDGKDVLAAMSQNRDPNKLIGDFFADPSGGDVGRGGRSIAAGDVNGDGVADLVVTGDTQLSTGQTIYIYNGADLIAGRVPGFGAKLIDSFFTEQEPGSALLSVATVNLDGDNNADLVLGSGAGQQALVKEYAGKDLVLDRGESLLFEMFPFEGAPTNGVFVG